MSDWQTPHWRLQVVTAVALVLAAGAPGAATPDRRVQGASEDAASALAGVHAREYKFLINPALVQPRTNETFQQVWGQVQAAAARNGFIVTEKPVHPMTVERSTKVYFDTHDQALWNCGYIVRLTTHDRPGRPDAQAGLTIKAIHADAARTLATPLAVVRVGKVRIATEQNIGFGPGGKLRAYVEKGVSFEVPVDSLGTYTLGDFGRYLPELLQLGLRADTALAPTRVFAAQVKPGVVTLPGHTPSPITLEAWSRTENGAPFAVDLSFGFSSPTALGASKADLAAGQFMVKVLHDDAAGLGSADNERWGGSKVRWLMNRALTAR